MLLSWIQINIQLNKETIVDRQNNETIVDREKDNDKLGMPQDKS